MALSVVRSAFRLSSRSLSTSVSASKQYGMPDPIEHATGIERRELEAIAAGNDDPFAMKAVKRIANSTRDNPTKIPSAFDKRIVGCVCEEGNTYINWMWLNQGEKKRCECGHWFTLYRVDPL